jgi:uncharacterized phage protein (TIGR02218 family)
MPRNVPAELSSHLLGGATTICVLVRIIPVQPGYSEYGVTTHDADVSYDDGDGPLLYSAAIGTEPSTLVAGSDMSVSGGESKQLMPAFDTPVSEADMVAGAYDFAKVRIYVVNYKDLTSGRHILLQTGTLGRNTITDNGLSWVTEIRGLTQKLKQSITEKWSLTCRATFGSVPIGTGTPGLKEERSPCKFDAEALWEEGTVDSVGTDTTQLFVTSGLSPAYGGSPGIVKWLTGNNAGRTDEVETFADDAGEQTIGLTFGSMFPIVAGDTFEFRDDCPKTPAACKARSNWPNYRGEPSIPVADNGALTAGSGSIGGVFGAVIDEVLGS